MTPVCYQLTDGSIVEAAKECSCSSHEGPHWLMMDALWKERNRALLAMASPLASMGFLREEDERLKLKLREMERRSIARIIKPGE